MSLTRQQKEERVAQVASELKDATSVVFVSHDGLTVDDVEALRDQLFATGSQLQVIPKRLLKLALKSVNLDFDPTTHGGQVAIIWGKDAVAPAKTLHTFAKNHENTKMLAGVLEGAVLSLEQITALAQLPSREQLLGQLVSVLAGPARGFVQVLSGVPKSFLYALKAISDTKN